MIGLRILTGPSETSLLIDPNRAVKATPHPAAMRPRRRAWETIKYNGWFGYGTIGKIVSEPRILIEMR